MSVDIMSIPFSPHYQIGLSNWIYAQMAQYPQGPEAEQQAQNQQAQETQVQQQQQQQQQYGTLYAAPVAAAAATASAQQMLNSSSHQDLQFSNLNQPIYPKVEHSSASHMQHLTDFQHHRHSQHHHQHSSLEEHQRQQIHAVAQHLQQQVSQPPANLPPTTQTSDPSSHMSEGTQKTNRLRKACDSCSIRKVKCDETGPPCRACAALDIPCTFDRPSRRRGPPNRHAEAIKRKRQLEAEQGGSPHGSASFSSPASPTNAAQALASLSTPSSSSALTAESICPNEILTLLIDDFFTYIHPLCPFPHEPTFRDAWKRREDLQNKSFLALLAAMIGALVASFPRKPRQHLKAHKREGLFPNHMSLVQRCQNVANTARGVGYLDSPSLNVYDAATSYFLGLQGTYTFRFRQGRLYFGECLNILRTLGLHKTKEQKTGQAGNGPGWIGANGGADQIPQDQNIDNITIEMGRRIFWTTFTSVKSMQQLGASFSELVIPPPTPSEPYPPLPAEVDDFCLYPTYTEPQPAGLLSMLTGFNANVKAFCSYNALATIEMAWGIDHIVDYGRQKQVLHESLKRCKSIISELPAELIVFANRGPFDMSNGGSQANGDGSLINFLLNSRRDMDQLSTNASERSNIDQSPEERRRMQHEIQKANIYASTLSTRSYLVEKFFNLCDAQARAAARSSSVPGSPSAGIAAAGLDGMIPQAPTSCYDMTTDEMRQERESIVKDLLVVLTNIDQVNMEPNADSFTMKIRSIAGTLLDATDGRRGQLASQAQEYLRAFLRVLMKLERVSPESSDPDQPEDEDSELRQWADLRDYQLKFAEQGGLLGVS